MIEVRHPAGSAPADTVIATLDELVVAYRAVEDETLAGPVVTEGELTLTEPEDIAAFLEQPRRDVGAWNAFQSDACFIESDGSIC